MKYKTVLAAAVAAVMLAGCIQVDRNSPSRVTQRPTVGQELLDLDRSRQAGLLTDGEYERLRSKIMERR